MARKILLADDSVTAQNMGRKILADAGYEVITVNNGSAALKKIAEQKPDLIVLDVYMPGYSGLEVCQRLKEAGETSRIPVLLTVGKLEPFKPEEAKRVRADGFIVKPFEASELLSALSKLEDRVVPRQEPSKPGRFARATAAIDEHRYDQSVADDEDSGWKSRLVFPPKKKEKAPDVDVDDPAIYNPLNKDLRTVVEHKHPEATPVAPPHSEEKHVNLSALAPEGLPKDVTPEEIAALAAAAAQVKGKIGEPKAAEPVAEMAVTAPAEAVVEKPETKEEVRAAEPAPSPAPEVPAATEPVVTLAEHPASENPEKESELEVAPSPSEVMAAIGRLEEEPVTGAHASSGNGSRSQSEATRADEPVTMAASAGAGAPSSRWAAVAVALAPEDSTVSLEDEMRKQSAAFPAGPVGEAVYTEAGTTTPQAATASTPVAESSPVVSDMVPAPVVPTPVVAAQEPAESLAAVASAAKEAVSAAVAELESVAASHVAPEASVPAEPLPPVMPEPPVAAIPEPPPAIEAKVEEVPAPEPVKAEEEPVEAKVPEAVAQASTPAEKAEEIKEVAAPVAEVPTPAGVTEAPSEQTGAKESSSDIAEANFVRPKAGGRDEMAKKESEISATTAAAWASWRRIRETGDPKPGQPESSANEPERVSAPQDTAAMAVAVGAESNPEEVPASLESDPEIASIVDSVLADMRPKIVEEIARKLGKKK